MVMTIRWSELKARNGRQRSSLLTGGEGVLPDYEREGKALVSAVREVQEERKREKREKEAEERDKRDEALVNSVMEAESVATAARKAGVSSSAALNRLRSESVRGKLREAREEIENAVTVRRLDVLNIFLEAIDMARMISDPSQMINGADKIAKMMGYYEPEEVKVDVSINYEGALRRIKELSDVELLELVDGKVVEGVAT